MPGPDKIMIIRHAEKPISAVPAGVDESGIPDPHSLTVRGWQRAGALVAFFGFPTRPEIKRPSAIVASTREDNAIAGETSAGRRAQQTVAALHARIGGEYWDDIAVGREDVLVERLKARAGVVLVAWTHKRIHQIVAGFVDFVAPEWNASRFDAVWILDRASNDAYRFTAVNQDLLPGDLPA
jgi:hypothetical protein